MAYKSQREKVIELIERYVIPGLGERDLEYYTLIDGISIQVGTTKGAVIEILNSYISSGKIKEVRVLTIPDSEVGNFIEKLMAKQRNLKEMDQEMLKIEQEVKKKD